MFEKFNSVRSRALVVASAMLASATVAMATPPVLPEIDFPISITSIASEIATAGATILLLVFGVWVGFKFVKKLMRRVASSV